MNSTPASADTFDFIEKPWQLNSRLQQIQELSRNSKTGGRQKWYDPQDLR